jgi:hypothetical protein
MNHELNIDVIFPIRDKSSAELMTLKAKCLHQAGVIGDHEEALVLRKAAEALTALASDRDLISAGRDVCVYGVKAYARRRSVYGFAA